ncbi:hypothetical protein M758_UG052300 [Ceratodon purpureus]|nr:hypothetical protein M758_UG052300 [Ceratodon purpureus]
MEGRRRKNPPTTPSLFCRGRGIPNAGEETEQTIQLDVLLPRHRGIALRVTQRRRDFRRKFTYGHTSSSQFSPRPPVRNE